MKALRGGVEGQRSEGVRGQGRGRGTGRGPVLDQQRHRGNVYAPDAFGPGGLLAAKDAQLADGGRESLAEGRHRRQRRAG